LTCRQQVGVFILRCPYCGADNPDESKFCGLCHRPLGVVAALGPDLAGVTVQRLEPIPEWDDPVKALHTRPQAHPHAPTVVETSNRTRMYIGIGAFIVLILVLVGVVAFSFTGGEKRPPLVDTVAGMQGMLGWHASVYLEDGGQNAKIGNIWNIGGRGYLSQEVDSEGHLIQQYSTVSKMATSTSVWDGGMWREPKGGDLSELETYMIAMNDSGTVGQADIKGPVEETVNGQPAQRFDVSGLALYSMTTDAGMNKELFNATVWTDKDGKKLLQVQFKSSSGRHLLIKYVRYDNALGAWDTNFPPPDWNAYKGEP
jgi:zinc-ribbon domain